MQFNYDLYLDHFGLEKRPFTLVPDPAFVFWSRQHRKAQAILEYGLMSRAPITLVTGEIGSGKTTLLRNLLKNIEEDVLVGFIANAAPADRTDMLRLILHALGVDAGTTDTYSELYQILEAKLVEEYGAGRRVVLIFDEAQNLDRSSLEHLRMLTNINFGEHELVQLMLVGQPELRDIVLRPDLTQLAQRISASVYLPGLSEEDVLGYIAHRLQIAGASEDIFSEDAAKLVYRATGGVPRLVNQLCDFALLYAYVGEKKKVTINEVQSVLDDELFFCAGRTLSAQVAAPEHDAQSVTPLVLGADGLK